MGALNVRTIDSLLHLIVRLTALELDLPPDFEPVFATDEAIAPAFDNLLEQSRRDERLHSRWRKHVGTFFPIPPQRGFLAGETLRERVMELLLPDHGGRNPSHSRIPLKLRKAMTRDLRDAVEQFITCLPKKLSCSAHLARALETCRKAAPGEPAAKLRHAAQSLSGRPPEQGIQKARRRPTRNGLSTMWDVIRKWDEDGVLLRPGPDGHAVCGTGAGTLRSGSRLPQARRGRSRRLRPRLARQVLSGDYGVPEAFCRLGTSLTHILVDEFQDTSREQWEAIHPLVLEALSRGGSLTWVGDVKQTISGWRGGDATLFDEVRSDAELCAVAPEPRVDILPTNWRSCRAIVETNNTLFRQLFRNSHG